MGGLPTVDQPFRAGCPIDQPGRTLSGAARLGWTDVRRRLGRRRSGEAAAPAGRWLPCMTFTMVTAAGMSTGDRIIRKIMNGINMALPTFLCGVRLDVL